MTIQHMGPGLIIAEHRGHQCSFINSTFKDMVVWALSIEVTKDMDKLDEIELDTYEN